MNQWQQFPFFVKPMRVSCSSNKSSIDKYSWHGSFTSHSVKSVLELASVFKHVQFHHFAVHIDVTEKLFCHCTVRTRCFRENHHTVIRNCFLDLIHRKCCWRLQRWWRAVPHPERRDGEQSRPEGCGVWRPQRPRHLSPAARAQQGKPRSDPSASRRNSSRLLKPHCVPLGETPAARGAEGSWRLGGGASGPWTISSAINC